MLILPHLKTAHRHVSTSSIFHTCHTRQGAVCFVLCDGRIDCSRNPTNVVTNYWKELASDCCGLDSIPGSLMEQYERARLLLSWPGLHSDEQVCGGVGR